MVLVVLAACAPRDPNAWTLRGEVKGVDGVVGLFLSDDIRIPAMPESLNITDGEFDYTGEVDHPMIAQMLYIDDDGLYNMLGTFVVEPGANLKIKGDLSWKQPAKGYVSGGRTNNRLSAFWKTIDKLGEGEMTPEKQDELERLSLEYVDGNTDNLGGVFMLFQMSTTGSGNIVPTEQVVARFGNFTPEMQATVMMTEIGRRIEQAKAKEAAFEGKYLEIVSTTPDGEELKLSDIIAANRFTLVDFWASWCGPCLAELPFLKETYSEYHDLGFEIFGVSLDDDGTAWRKAIADNEMIWPQVGSMMGWKEPAAELYGVRSIPASWLIDADGKIVARNLRGKAVAEKLKELMQ